MQMMSSEQKVENWQSQQDFSLSDSILRHTETLRMDAKGGSLFYRFAVSESGESIGVAGQYTKPPLSVTCLNSDKTPLLFARTKQYRSIIFTKISDKEYLAAVCDSTIDLWDIENCTARIVYKLQKEGLWGLCSIDETSVGFWQINAADGLKEVFVLNTETKQWSIGSIVKIKDLKAVDDMCYMRSEDGSPCLVLCSYADQRILTVEMPSGRVRWQIDQEQIGKHGLPWSICTDQNGTVCVIETVYNKLLLLSPNDGSVLQSINLSQYEIINPACIRSRREHLYVGHGAMRDGKFCISKFVEV